MKRDTRPKRDTANWKGHTFHNVPPPPPPEPRVAGAPPRKPDVDVAAISARIKTLEAQLATARGALLEARDFVRKPYRWKNHLAMSRRIDDALQLSGGGA